MAKPCTPHLIPQAEQFFEIETANVGGRGALPSRSLGVPKGIFSFAKENIPFDLCSATGAAFSPPAQCRDKSSAVALHPPRTRARTWHYVLFLFRVRSPLLREPHKIIHTRVVKPCEPDEHVARDVALAGLVVGIADLRAAQIVRQALLRQVAVLSQVSNASIHFASLHPEFVFRFCKEVYVKQNVILCYITKRYIIFQGWFYDGLQGNVSAPLQRRD